MGRKVNFKIEGSLLQSEIVKVDKTKLYLKIFKLTIKVVYINFISTFTHDFI